jgi:hypothetical protein
MLEGWKSVEERENHSTSVSIRHSKRRKNPEQLQQSNIDAASEPSVRTCSTLQNSSFYQQTLLEDFSHPS